ncbi:O-antigen ligase like membrane protein [Longilinea arvoryzae]|uniref:O-antigen ligase like membrane protein n=1 Tax=Longilinea arvoryzae TaxID=360412 RepID=A0A0S7BFX8_9CHLR|nr:O-antigen ligase family protein [Longilinea arvoryzae]GAP13475.1 O-antigen ligase like membrane protein [Longilinea arvoryzae]
MKRIRKWIDPLHSFNFTWQWLEQNRALLIRAIVLSVLAISILYMVPRMAVGMHRIPLLFIAAIIGVAGLAVLIANPSLAIVGIIPAALVIPFGIGTGTGTELHAGILIVLAATGLWFLDMLVVKRDFHLLASRPVVPLLLLVVSTLISFGFGQMPWFYRQHASISAQLGGTMLYILAACAFLVTAHRLSERGLVWAVGIFIALAGLFMVTRSFSDRFPGLTWPILNRYADGSTGSLFWVWAFCLAISQFVFNKRLKLRWKAALGVVLLAFFFTAFYQARDWTSGWLPALFGAAFMFFISFRKARVPLVLAVFLILALNFSQIQNMLMGGGNEYSMVTRLEAWQILFKIIAINPILGVGPANYYFYTPLFPIRGYSVQFNSHNNYVDLLAQTGVIGCGLFVWFMVEVTLLGMRLLSRAPEGFPRAFVYGAIGGVIGTAVAGMFGDWIIPFVYNVGFAGFRASLIGWLFMGALVAMERFYPANTASPTA